MDFEIVNSWPDTCRWLFKWIVHILFLRSRDDVKSEIIIFTWPVGELVEMNNDLIFCENLNKVIAISDDKKRFWNVVIKMPKNEKLKNWKLVKILGEN